MRSIQVNTEQGRPVMGRTRVSWESHMWQENEISVGSGVVRPQTCPSNARTPDATSQCFRQGMAPAGKIFRPLKGY